MDFLLVMRCHFKNKERVSTKKNERLHTVQSVERTFSEFLKLSFKYSFVIIRSILLEVRILDHFSLGIKKKSHEYDENLLSLFVKIDVLKS